MWQGRPPPPTRPDAVTSLPRIQGSPYLNQRLNTLPGGIQSWQNDRVGYWNKWYSAHGSSVNEFWNNHAARWDSISNFRRDHWNVIRNRTNEWRDWRGSVWGYRLARSNCVLDSTRDFYCDLFTPDWWAGCGWWHRPAFVRPIDPWWWWRPCTWGVWTYVYSEPTPAPVTDDYGTDVVIEGDQVYVEGQPVASVSDYRAQAVQIGNPAASPGPPAPAETEGAAEEWMPLGVWALTQESQGDAHMFYQLSVQRGGVISGAYTNVLTGGSDPVNGSVDKISQRVVWHTGDASATMVETNLDGLTRDHAAAMVHFPSGQTQTWLLVRLSGPELPAAPVAVDVKGGAAAPSK